MEQKISDILAKQKWLTKVGKQEMEYQKQKIEKKLNTRKSFKATEEQDHEVETDEIELLKRVIKGLQDELHFIWFHLQKLENK